MHLRRNPHVALTPIGELPKLLDFRVALDRRVAQRQPLSVVHSHVASESREDLSLTRISWGLCETGARRHFIPDTCGQFL